MVNVSVYVASFPVFDSRSSERERETHTQRGRLVPDTETRKSRGGRITEKDERGERETASRGITLTDTHASPS